MTTDLVTAITAKIAEWRNERSASGYYASAREDCANELAALLAAVQQEQCICTEAELRQFGTPDPLCKATTHGAAVPQEAAPPLDDRGKILVVLAETRRALDTDRYDVVRRKLDWLVDTVARAASPTPWQPIASMKREKGVYILVALIEGQSIRRVSEAAHNGLGWYDKGGHGCHWATHGMPLPAPPEEPKS